MTNPTFPGFTAEATLAPNATRHAARRAAQPEATVIPAQLGRLATVAGHLPPLGPLYVWERRTCPRGYQYRCTEGYQPWCEGTNAQGMKIYYPCGDYVPPQCGCQPIQLQIFTG
jgi:hypothetical protein